MRERVEEKTRGREVRRRAPRSPSPVNSISTASVVSTEQRARIYLKRFVFSRKGQILYLGVIGFMMVLSMFLIFFSLINTTDRTRYHKHVYKTVLWIQILEATVDLTFLLEIGLRAFILQEVFWASPMCIIDILIAIGCVVTFCLYNFVRPDTTNANGEEMENIIYIARQTIRFVRCVYFFLWFSDSVVEFRRNKSDVPSIVTKKEVRRYEKRVRRNRMTSPFVSPSIFAVEAPERDMEEDEELDIGEADVNVEDNLPELIHIGKKTYSFDVADDDEPQWWNEVEKMGLFDEERALLEKTRDII